MPDATKAPAPWSDEWIDAIWQRNRHRPTFARAIAAKAFEEAANRCMNPACKRRIRARAKVICGK